MTQELTVLILVALLQAAQLMLAATLSNRQLGPDFNAGPRDAPRPALTGAAGRADRALKNHYESLPLFIAAILVLALADKTSALISAAAWAYLGARILYVPAYLFGWTPWRSVIWGVGFLATLTLLVSALA